MSDATLRLHDDEPTPAAVAGRAADGPRLGSRLGRYVVLSTLGMGNMGIVVAAYDPELDRKAALKLLRPRGDRSNAAHARLLREAQALAKLNHPNVVTIYDVGEYEGQVFVAMEFVQGTTLREWLASPRRWPDIVRVFAAAGRGLAAAHAVGLVHRDFKPDNVMIDAHERVRVMDFGIARMLDTPADEVAATALDDPQAASDSSLGAPALDESLTRTGMLIGTPAYMAPEQWLRLEVTPLSDQFSFCVALFEALHGRRPFGGGTLELQARSVVRGEIEPPSRARKVPAHLRTVVQRGLAREPSERHRSMSDLLDALTDDPRARWRRRGLVTLIAGLSLAASWGIWHATQEAAPLASCDGAPARLAGVWDEPRKAELHAAIAATGRPYAAATSEGVEQRLDDYVAAWTAGHREACEAHQRGEQSGELLDLRMRCLDERLQHLDATVSILSEGRGEGVDKAIEAVGGLPSLARCADETALRTELPPPDSPELARRVEALDEQLITAEVLRRAGTFERGRALAEGVVDDALALGYEPLQARAWLVAGKLREAMGDYAAAEQLLGRAFASALALGMRMEASTLLVGVIGAKQARLDAAHVWAATAEPLTHAAATPEANARLLNILGNLALARGDLEQARVHHEQCLAIRQATLDLEHPHVAHSFNNLGVVASAGGNEALARSYHERALAIRERAVGPEHPDVAHSLNNLGNVALAQGEPERARAYHERALAIRERALAPNHTDIAASLVNLGNVAYTLGEHEDARLLFERSLAIDEQTLGSEHPDLGHALTNLGHIAQIQGERERANAFFERALAIREAALPPDHPDIAISLALLGDAALAAGDFALAKARHERALAIGEAALGSDHPNLGFSLTGLGAALIGLGAAGDALVHLERAATIRDAAGSPDLPWTRFELARALWDAPREAGRDRVCARELALQAEAALADSPSELGIIREWLATHLE